MPVKEVQLLDEDDIFLLAERLDRAAHFPCFQNCTLENGKLDSIEAFFGL